MSVYEKLREPLPCAAIKQHPTKTYLSTINPAFVIDRLNEVLGLGKWAIRYEIISENEKMVVAKGHLSAPEYGIEVEQYGGNDNQDRGDAYKGACTDALTKCASYVGVGLHVWMNEQAKPTNERQKQQDSQAKHPRPTEKQAQLIDKLIANPCFTDAERLNFNKAIEKGGRDWSSMIDFLKAEIEKRGVQ